MHVGVSASIGIGDGDATKRLPRDLKNAILVVAGIEQEIGYIAVAVRPAIDRNRRDIARVIKTARAEHAIELIADAGLKILESRGKKLGLPNVKLATRVKPGIRCAWRVQKMHNDRALPDRGDGDSRQDQRGNRARPD